MKAAVGFVVISVVAVSLSACQAHEEAESAPSQNVRVVAAAPAPVATTTVLSGEVRARVQSDLSFRVGGQIVDRFVDVGSRVKAGALLARLDPDVQQTGVDVAAANLMSVEAKYNQARLAFERQRTLFERRVVDRSTFDQAQEALNVAQGSLDSAKASLAAARDELGYTELRADADGTIVSRSMEVGQVVQATQPVLTLAHDGARDAVFGVFETLLSSVDPRQPVAVAPLIGPGQPVEASVREVSPIVDMATGTIRLKTALPATPASLPLGTAVSGTFATQGGEPIVIPFSAIASSGGIPSVWVVDPESRKVSLRTIQIAEYQTSGIAVEHGLEPKDLVVTHGGKLLREGQIVNILAEDAK